MDTTRKSNKNLEAALSYAEMGYKIFPCAPGAKVPKHGCHWTQEATTDREQIKRWWAENPDYNIGLPTGEGNNLFVIDLDIKSGEYDGRKTLEDLERKNNSRLKSDLVVITPSRGMHYYFAYTAGLRNSCKSLGAGIDSRGHNGYVLAPPSRTEVGLYMFTVGIHGRKIVLQEMPQWLLAEIEERNKPKVPPVKRAAVTNPTTSLHPWAVATFRGVINEVRACVPGQRNAGLNKGAHRLGGLVATNNLNYEEVIEELHAAAAFIGLGPIEAERTIQSGIIAGTKNPYSPPLENRTI